jgi:hypothetical protein
MIINISQSPVKAQIQFVCVDDLIKNGNLPSFIKSVPTIFKKDTNTLLKGDSATEWIRSFNQTEDTVGDDIFFSLYEHSNIEAHVSVSTHSDNYKYLGICPFYGSVLRRYASFLLLNNNLILAKALKLHFHLQVLIYPLLEMPLRTSSSSLSLDLL